VDFAEFLDDLQSLISDSSHEAMLTIYILGQVWVDTLLIFLLDDDDTWRWY